MQYLAAIAVLSSAPFGAVASAATQFLIGVPICTSGVCPFPNPNRTEIQSGVPFPIFLVAAADNSGTVDTTYVGTVFFTSTDGAAVLPTSYTFTPADQGVHNFSPAVILRSPGRQTITLSDPTGSITGNLSILVTTGIPANSSVTRALLAVLLGISGAWLLRGLAK